MSIKSATDSKQEREKSFDLVLMMCEPGNAHTGCYGIGACRFSEIWRCLLVDCVTFEGAALAVCFLTKPAAGVTSIQRSEISLLI